MKRLLAIVCVAASALPASAQHMAAPEMYRTSSSPGQLQQYLETDNSACRACQSGWSNSTGTSFPFAHVSRFLGLCEPIYACDRQFYTHSPLLGRKGKHCCSCATYAPVMEASSYGHIPSLEEPLPKPFMKPADKLPEPAPPERRTTREPELAPTLAPNRMPVALQTTREPELDPTLPPLPTPPLKPVAQWTSTQPTPAPQPKPAAGVESTRPVAKVAAVKPTTRLPALAPWPKALPEVRSVFPKPKAAPSVKAPDPPPPPPALANLPEGEHLLITTLRTHTDEEMRRRAAVAIGKSGTRSLESLKTLNLVVSGSGNDGNPAEKSPRVKEAALAALQQCLSRPQATTVQKLAQAPPPITRVLVEPPPQKPAPEPTRPITLPPESVDQKLAWSTAQRRSTPPAQPTAPAIEPVSVPIRENPFRAVD